MAAVIAQLQGDVKRQGTALDRLHRIVLRHVNKCDKGAIENAKAMKTLTDSVEAIARRLAPIEKPFQDLAKIARFTVRWGAWVIGVFFVAFVSAWVAVFVQNIHTQDTLKNTAAAAAASENSERRALAHVIVTPGR